MGSWLSTAIHTDEHKVTKVLHTIHRGDLAFAESFFETFLASHIQRKKDTILDGAMSGKPKYTMTFLYESPTYRPLYAAIIGIRQRTNIFDIHMKRCINEIFSDVSHALHIKINDQKITISITILEKY
jgi:hypothetical protein